MKFQIIHEDTTGSKARVAKVSTHHGDIETPVFMPVGTRATVKTMTPRVLREVGTQILLGNTYHLAVRPGEKLIEEMGGLHKFMAWDGPILTDSGGFQAFSLAGLRKLSKNGVTFRSHIDGALFEFTPERVMEIQKCLGSDIVMPLDHCIGWPCTKEEAKKAAQTSIDWLKRSQDYELSSHQNLFGIVQGSGYNDLREWCAEEMVKLDLPGYAIGGLAVGETKDVMQVMIEHTNKILPVNKPRYLMGVGTPVDLIKAISRGVDMFDCVMPTRNARGGGFFTWDGKQQIRNSQYIRDDSPLDSKCGCYTCQTFTRSYLHHLFSKKVEEILGLSLLTLHNIYFYHDFTKNIRQAIVENRFQSFMSHFLETYKGS
ncbi:tRNA guanosine(34) transglycosylase Tgt [Candidatus Uabimicrobium sp. HlEnr_7]|uniref:tRNA guanosine(34) transglycosylase Tgt n=1 Tax=Candidatus Uabimicrobium helgolandensis TaxID=3095367 RepID=UPI003558572F